MIMEYIRRKFPTPLKSKKTRKATTAAPITNVGKIIGILRAHNRKKKKIGVPILTRKLLWKGKNLNSPARGISIINSTYM